MSSSRLSICSVSTLKYAVSTWCSATVARTTTPVRPIPATVAQNSSSVWGELLDRAIRRDQRERPHVVAEAADDVVGLAVDVGADRPADRDLTGARQHRQPQAVREGGAHQGVEADARVDIDEPALGVDCVDLPEAGHDEHGAARVLRGIAVGASEAARDDPAGTRAGDRSDHVLDRAGCDDPGERGRGAAPSVEQLCVDIAHCGRGYPGPPTLSSGW